MTEHLFLGDTTYPHFPDAEDHPVLVIDAAGNPVLETYGSVKAPANYSFECVNNFVHCEDPQYEELQYLALGMATSIQQLEAELAEAKKDQARYLKFMELFIADDFPCQVAIAETKAEWDAIIDATIEDQGK